MTCILTFNRESIYASISPVQCWSHSWYTKNILLETKHYKAGNVFSLLKQITNDKKTHIRLQTYSTPI